MSVIKEYQYYAFISYDSRDGKEVRELYDFLMDYKIPRELHSGENYVNVSGSIKPIFLDSESLPVGGDREEYLRAAVRHSLHLIPVCTKHSVKVKSETGKCYVRDCTDYVLNELKWNKERVIPIIFRGNADERAEMYLPDTLVEHGITAADTGKMEKEHAFCDVVAGLLHVPKKDVRMYWDREYKPRTRYFEDYVMHNGVPAGINELTEAEATILSSHYRIVTLGRQVLSAAQCNAAGSPVVNGFHWENPKSSTAEPPVVKQAEPPAAEPPAVKQVEFPAAEPPAVKQVEFPAAEPPAVKQAEPPCVRPMAKAGKDINQPDTQGNTPLMEAVGRNDVDRVVYLTMNGANPRAINRAGQSVSDFAKSDELRSLLRDACERLDRALLSSAAMDDDINGIEALLDSGADINCTDVSGATPLMFACSHGKLQLVEYLIEHGSRIRVSDSKKKNPLVYAAENGHTDVVDLLARRGGGINVNTNTWMSPLVRAAMGKHTQVIKLLLRCGAKQPDKYFSFFGLPLLLWGLFCSAVVPLCCGSCKVFLEYREYNSELSYMLLCGIGFIAGIVGLILFARGTYRSIMALLVLRRIKKCKA